MKRICFVTTEFHGLFKNGGIGTANTSLALAMAKQGHAVTVAFANVDAKGPRAAEGSFAGLQQHYAGLGITLDFTPLEASIVGAQDSRLASYNVYRYLRKNRFDIVFFNDNGGHGYYSMLAKRAGQFPNAPSLYVVTHGSMAWAHDLNAIPYSKKNWVLLNYMERRAVEMADKVISPSRYLIDWMTERGWTMPAGTRVVQNIVQVAKPKTSSEPVWHKHIREIVFFGRLEYRKGLEIFCDAIDLLEAQRDLSGLQVTFLGKFQRMAGLHSGIYILERSRKWKSFVRMISNFDQDQAVEYLSREDVLPVIPSIAENSPCVVAECLQTGLPFLATGTGGTFELLAEHDRTHNLFEPTPPGLMAKLDAALRGGQRSAEMAVPPAQTEATWLDLVANTPRIADDDAAADCGRPDAHEDVHPTFSVCFVASGDAATQACLESFLTQDVSGVEILLGEREGTSGAEAFPQNGRIAVRRIPLAESVDDAAARNTLAQHATGEFLLFVNARDVVLAPGCLQAFASAAARLDTDILCTPALQHGADGFKIAHLPLGNCLQLGALENCFGEGLIAVRRRRFFETAGFEATGDRRFDDWAFLAKAALRGLRLEVLPEALYALRPAAETELEPSDRIMHFRKILEAYRTQPLGDFLQAFEILLETGQATAQRLAKVASGFGPVAADLAMSLSALRPLSDDVAEQKFFQFCVARDRGCEGLDFLSVNGITPPATPVPEDADKSPPGAEIVHAALTATIAGRVAPAGGAFAITRATDGIARLPLSAEIRTLKASGVCDPGTGIVCLDVEAIDGNAEVAAALCLPDHPLEMTSDGAVPGETVAWSGWVHAGAGKALDLALRIRAQQSAPLDLYLLSRADSSSGAPSGAVIWRRASARHLLRAAAIPADPAVEAKMIPLAEDARLRSIQLTEVDADEGVSFRPGKNMLIRPLPGKTNLVRIPNALPAGVRGVQCVFSLNHERAHETEFGFWVRPASHPATGERELEDGAVFSGWIKVSERFKKHLKTIAIPEPPNGEQDLYLATRVRNKRSTGNCRAVWHEIFALGD